MRKQSLLIFVLPAMLCIPLLARAEDDILPLWLLKLKLSADFRYRHELVAAQQVDAAGSKVQAPDRNRERIRLRLGITYQVNSQTDLVTRFATSTTNGAYGDPVSTNQDLTGASAPKPFWVDRAYGDYHPWKELAVRAGRFPMPYEGTDLVWDGDLNLEGIVIAGQSKPIGGKWNLLGRAGGYWLYERSVGPDQGLFGAQGGLRYDDGTAGGQVAVGYYDYTNLKNAPVLVGAFGNTVAGGNYINDYNLLDVSGLLSYKQPQWEGAVIGDFVTNTAADSNSTGFLAGFALKFRQLPLDWELGYNYRDVQADAVVGAFDDSDPRGGGTNFNGHKVSLFFTVARNTRVGGTYFADVIDPDHAKLHYNRLQVDAELKF